MSYRILVTGSRTWTDWQQIKDSLHRAYLDAALADRTPNPSPPVLITGACPAGADKMAEDVWLANVGPDTIERHPADWDRWGSTAGHRRNIEMVDSHPDLVLAFLDWCRKLDCANFGRAPHRSHGASQCADYAESQGIEVRRFYP